MMSECRVDGVMQKDEMRMTNDEHASLKECEACGMRYDAAKVPGGMCARCLMMGGVDEDRSTAAAMSENWQPPTVEALQAMLPGYEILGLIGRGGMGAVYKARQPSLGRLVAIKVLPVLKDELGVGFVERFRNEARLMARMSHPGIVHVYDFGELEDGMFFFVMEFVEGTDVAQMMKSSGRLPPALAARITEEVCAALHHAHEAGVIHRDIKPANVLISTSGQVKLVDFGLAKQRDPEAGGVTGTGLTLGTPDFAAPESLISGALVDPRTDLYSAGVMLYHMLTGEIPRGVFKPASREAGAHTSFDDIIRRAMSADREHRYPTAAAMREAVKRAANPRMAASWRWLGLAAVLVLIFAGGVALRPVMMPHEAVLTDRQAAERVAAWVFSKKGRVAVRSGTELITASRSTDLPAGPLVIERMLFTSIEEPGINITDAELELWLPRVPDLEHFIVEDSPKLLSKLGERGLMALARLLNLERLSLEHAPLTDDLMFHLAPFTKVTALNVSNTKISGTGFAHLRRNLVWLQVAGCLISEAGWNEIREFKRLQGVKVSPNLASSLPRDEDGYVCQPALRSLLWPEKAP